MLQLVIEQTQQPRFSLRVALRAMPHKRQATMGKSPPLQMFFSPVLGCGCK
jgi:hypothetical protein